jgi:hypothetical protein
LGKPENDDGFKKLEEHNNLGKSGEMNDYNILSDENYMNILNTNYPQQNSVKLENIKRQMEEKHKKEREKIERLKQIEIDKGSEERLRNQQELKELDEKFEQELNNMKREQERGMQELKERQRNQNIPYDTAQKQLEELHIINKKKEK